MNAEVAERLLRAVMGDPAEAQFADQLSVLRSLANYKYDEYQQYAPGREFIAYLASWLFQFQDLEERRNALRFVQERLIYVSDLEMRHLVRILARDRIPSLLQQHVATQLGIPLYRVAELRSRPEFGRAMRASLFLGMSDGARIDQLRRNSPNLSNEQFAMTHELNDQRVKTMIDKLRADLADNGAFFEYIFLVDDFAGSGRTIARHDKGELPDGRLVRFHRDTLKKLMKEQLCPQIFVALYIATIQAVDHLKATISSFQSPLWNPRCEPQVINVMAIDDRARLVHGRNDEEFEVDREFDSLLHKCYDEAIEDEHKGRVLHGYAECGLPLVLTHNTPNNSLYLLWERKSTNPLFPRFQRHSSQMEAN